MTVVDNGCGIPSIKKAQMFKLINSYRFVNSNYQMEDIGLSLLTSQLIVKQYGGSLDFTSEIKEGSTFFFTFEV